MGDSNLQYIPDKGPTLLSVRQQAIERAKQLNSLVETTAEKQVSIKRRTAKRECQINKLMKKIQKLKKKWRVIQTVFNS